MSLPDIGSSPAARTEYLTREDGTRLACTVAGAGPTVVLAHGYLLDRSLYDFVLPPLVKAGYRTIAFDQRGHGESKGGSDGYAAFALASDYAAVLEHFAVKDGTLVAHSMGAFLAVVFCLNHPQVARDRLSQLVLVGGNAGNVAHGSLQNRLQAPLLKSGLLRPLWRWKPAGQSLMRQLFGSAPDASLVERTRQTILHQDERVSLPMLRAMLGEDYYPRLGEIPVATKVICGELDATCPRWHSERLGAEIPNATNAWLPGVGHMVPFEAPNAILDAVQYE